MSSVIFRGRTYPCRVVDVQNYGERFVSVESLEKALFDGEGTYVSDKARLIDEDILFFVPDSCITLGDEELAAFIAGSIGAEASERSNA